MAAEDELPECPRSLPVNPGHALVVPKLEPLEELRHAMAAHQEVLLERLSRQDRILEDLRTSKGWKPRQKNLLEVDVSKTSSVKSRESNLKPRRPSQRGSFTPTFFSTYTQADLTLKRGANQMHAVRSRRKFASLKTEAIETPAEATWAQRILLNPAFDIFFAIIVIANTVFIGVDVEMSISCPHCQTQGMHIVHYCFTAIFILELVIRLTAQGAIQFYFSDDWMWAALDTFIVVSSIWDIVMDLLYYWNNSGGQSFSELSSFKAFRVIRITRIVKAVRLMRIFRFIMALRMLINSILHTLKSLFWAMVLLMLIIYAFSVLLAQVVNDHVADPEGHLSAANEALVRNYFDSVPNTMLTLFMSISNGVNWSQVLPALHEISIIWVFVYIFFIAFTYFAVLNVVTGVFCQSAIDSAQNDHAAIVQSILENKESHLKKIKALFSKMGTGNDDMNYITFPMFEEKINDPEVRDYFESLRLDIWDAWTFFKMVDQDGGGTIPMDEFLMGCLRLRGQARSVDVGRVIHDQQWMIKNFGKFQTHVEVQLKEVSAQLQHFIASFASSTHSSGSEKGQESSIEEQKEKDDVDGAVVQTYVVPQPPWAGGYD